MALTSNNSIMASDFVSMKARVKAEMNRRKYVGSLTSYAGTTYDYTVSPASNGVISIEHANKLIVPINAINSSGYSEKKAGDIINELDTLNIKLTAHEKQALYGATDCASSCSGLCRTGCSGTCSGCGGACSYSCSGTCDGGCDTTCSGGCDTTCSGGCQGHCGDGCYGCTGACRTNCSGCSGSCKGTCSRTCNWACYGTSGHSET